MRSILFSINLVTVRGKNANCRVATRSVYRPEDRRQNIDTVLRTERQHNKGVSQDRFTLKKDLRVGLYRASDRRDELAQNCVTLLPFKPVDTALGDTDAVCLTNTNSTEAGDAPASNSATLSVSNFTQPSATRANTSVSVVGVNTPSKAACFAEPTLQGDRVSTPTPQVDHVSTSPPLSGIPTPGTIAPVSDNSSIGVNNSLALGSVNSRHDYIDMGLPCGVDYTKQAALLATDIPEEAIRTDMAVSSNSLPKSDYAIDSMTSRGARRRAQEEQKVELILNIEESNYVNVELKTVYAKKQELRTTRRQERQLRAKELFSDPPSESECIQEPQLQADKRFPDNSSESKCIYTECEQRLVLKAGEAPKENPSGRQQRRNQGEFILKASELSPIPPKRGQADLTNLRRSTISRRVETPLAVSRCEKSLSQEQSVSVVNAKKPTAKTSCTGSTKYKLSPSVIAARQKRTAANKAQNSQHTAVEPSPLPLANRGGFYVSSSTAMGTASILPAALLLLAMMIKQMFNPKKVIIKPKR